MSPGNTDRVVHTFHWNVVAKGEGSPCHCERSEAISITPRTKSATKSLGDCFASLAMTG